MGTPSRLAGSDRPNWAARQAPVWGVVHPLLSLHLRILCLGMPNAQSVAEWSAGNFWGHVFGHAQSTGRVRQAQLGTQAGPRPTPHPHVGPQTLCYIRNLDVSGSAQPPECMLSIPPGPRIRSSLDMGFNIATMQVFRPQKAVGWSLGFLRGCASELKPVGGRGQGGMGFKGFDTGALPSPSLAPQVPKPIGGLGC